MGRPRSLAILAVTALFATLSCARPRASTSTRRAAADDALYEGERQLAHGRRRKASHFLFRALAGYRDAADLRGEAASLLALGRLNRHDERHSLALDFFSKAREIATDTATRNRATALYGETLVALGSNDLAVEVLEELLVDRVDGLEPAKVWLLLARAHRARGKLRESLVAAEKAFALGGSREEGGVLTDLLVALGEHERAFELSQGVSLAWVQRSLLDRETRVLAYVLGEDGSLLWDVTTLRARAHVLSGRSSLESLARDVQRELTRGDAHEARMRLSSELLGSIALSRDDRRLVVVSSGELAVVPFAALYSKGARAPLLSRLEVVRVSSLSHLRALRGRPRRTYDKWVAVAADPTYGLAGARREARAIAKLGPPGAVTLVEGVEARADIVLGDLFGGSRILHLATHGVPGRGLVLADAVLGVADLEHREVLAETVVVSACATDLTDALLGRGARRVVASRWTVDDEATAELMRRFYAELFSGAPPAAALRQAQVTLRRHSRFSAPRYWAAFELYGDWTT